ncbi:MAG: glycosyltransferase family 2 protein [Paludibacteraceae bacterium]|nr:glycosyltransferase family 2 protein [Paludibacteraceae bacterium]
MKCSVIILNWNGEKVLRQFLPSVLELTDSPDCEVIVADNGSTDNSIEVVQQINTDILSRGISQPARIFEYERNYGFAEGYNRAISQVDSEYVVLLNSDVEVTKNWLDSLLNYMDKHLEVAACQPKILSWRNKKCFEHAGAAGGQLDKLGYPFCRGRIMDYAEEDYGQYETIATCFWASGACMCVRTEIYEELGGLDEDFFAHMEEIDLCWRLNSRSWWVACVPQSVVYHMGGASLSYGNPRKTFLNFRNNLLMLYKNMSCGQLLPVLCARFFMDYAAAANDFVHGRIGNAWAIVRARWAFLFSMPKFAAKRRENLRKTTVPELQTISRRSIVWDYYIRHLKH